MFPISGTDAPNLVDPLDELLLIIGNLRNRNLLRYAPENRSSPRAATGKRLLKN
jgi:hypothetical protein